MGRIVILDIPKPETVDWLNSNDRLFHLRKAQLTRQWRKIAATALWAQHPEGVKPFETLAHVTAHIWKPTRRRYDPGNLYPTLKAICDGFTDAGLWADDDHEHVLGPDLRHGGYGTPKLVITIEEAK